MFKIIKLSRLIIFLAIAAVILSVFNITPNVIGVFGEENSIELPILMYHNG